MADKMVKKIQTDTQDIFKQRERQDERTNRLIGIPNTRTKLETDRQTDRHTYIQTDR